jgi:hypothetical protein
VLDIALVGGLKALEKTPIIDVPKKKTKALRGTSATA